MLLRLFHDEVKHDTGGNVRQFSVRLSEHRPLILCSYKNPATEKITLGLCWRF